MSIPLDKVKENDDCWFVVAKIDGEWVPMTSCFTKKRYLINPLKRYADEYGKKNVKAMTNKEYQRM